MNSLSQNDLRESGASEDGALRAAAAPPPMSGGGERLSLREMALIAFTRRGCELAKKLACGLADKEGFADADMSVCGPSRLSDDLAIGAYESLETWTDRAFSHADALVYVGACGIAVRAIAPHVRDKFSDPAVVSVDEAGRFAVPLLSGHVGGANELARAIAEVTGGQAVVSTATDVNSLFAVDEWAARRNLAITERTVAKEISARLLEGGTVGFASDLDVEWDVPSAAIGENTDLGFVVSYDESFSPFDRTLHLCPLPATVGVGCRKGAFAEAVETAVEAALSAAHVPMHAVGVLASIDVKQDEPAIQALAAKRGWELRFYSAEELAAVPGEFASSEFVRQTVGVDNVCERAAMAAGSRLLLEKRACDGVTVAVAIGR